MFGSHLAFWHPLVLNKKQNKISTYSINEYCLTGKYKYSYNLISAELNSWQIQFEQHLACIKNIPPGYFLNLF
jgi:hypothetical protein